MLELTRLYKVKGNATVKKQKILISEADVESVRPSNRLEGQRATVAMRSGKEYEVAEKFSSLKEKISYYF